MTLNELVNDALNNRAQEDITLSKLFCLFSEKGSTQNGKNFSTHGTNSFLLEQAPFSGGIWCAGNQKEDSKLTKVVDLVKMAVTVPCIANPLYIDYCRAMSLQSTIPVNSASGTW